MLHIEGLRFSWGEELHFTYDLSVARGEILAVQGPSGVGKTTLLELIAGFQAPTAGSLGWDGDDLRRLPPWAYAALKRNLKFPKHFPSGQQIDQNWSWSDCQRFEIVPSEVQTDGMQQQQQRCVTNN